MGATTVRVWFCGKDNRGTENQVTNHLSRLEDEAIQELGKKARIVDTFVVNHVLTASHDLIPRFTNFSNNPSSYIVPTNLSFYQRNKFMHDVKIFFMDEQYL